VTKFEQTLRLAWILVAACSLTRTPTFGQARIPAPWRYQSVEGDYVLTLPPGWRQITNAEFGAQEKLFKDQTGDPAPKYDAGFQLVRRKPFEYPYMFVQHGIRRPISYGELKAQVNSQLLSESAREASEKAAPVTGPMRFTAIHLIEEKRIIVADFESNGDDESALKGMTAYCVGRQGVVSVNFYAIKTDYLSHVATFQKILDSFQYLPGYEYEEVRSSRPAPPAESNWDVRGIVSKAIAFAVLATIWRVLQRKSNAS